MKYEDLNKSLWDLEKKSRNVFKLNKELGVGAQFFVLDKATEGKDLPIVVLVGVNYWQCSKDEWKKQAEYGEFLYKGVVPKKEDSTLINIRKRLSQDWSNSPIPKDGFHMVFANLSPIITFEAWGEMCAEEKKALLEDSLCYNHLLHLKETLAGAKVIWVGHTKSVHKELEEQFKKAQIGNHTLSWNISWWGDPHFEPEKG